MITHITTDVQIEKLSEQQLMEEAKRLRDTLNLIASDEAAKTDPVFLERIDCFRALRMLAEMQKQSEGTLALSPEPGDEGNNWVVLDLAGGSPSVVYRDRSPVGAVLGANKVLRIILLPPW